VRFILLASLVVACSSRSSMTIEELGATAFTDTNLSEPPGQSCADCHSPTNAFRDPESDHSTSAGAVAGRFGARNSPTILYAAKVPPRDLVGDRVIGGLFWDGRANSLEDQAQAPLLNPLEMNNPDKLAVAGRLRDAGYAQGFRDVFGEAALDDPDEAVAHLTQALAAYERTPALSPFTSRYDQFVAGTAKLTDPETRGLAIFERACSSCHPPPMFTDYSYANLGVPRYANNLYYLQPPPLNPDGALYVDHGLATITHDPRDDGAFRVPTLRNIARTGPYGHNGYFANLPYFIDFLNTRDVGSSRNGSWAPPEVAANVSTAVGHLDLDATSEADLLAFLGTLSDQ
jgi:cytochrome c peroxidase